MRVPRRTATRRWVAAVLAAAVVSPLTTAAIAPTIAAADPAAEGNAAERADARIERIQWLTNRRVAIWVASPAMRAPIQVQLLLARDWNTRADATFPALYLLDGMRARDTENGWTYETNASHFYADKNVTVILPVGGESSFYADWLEADNGKLYKWETFLTKELPPLLHDHFRVNGVNGIAGLSMGGTAAMALTARNPELYAYAASYSGYLDISSFGMPEAIAFAQRDAGGYDSNKMFGPSGAEAWKAHDPKLLVEKLKGKSLYVSAGSGNTGPYDRPSAIPGVPDNYAGFGLELLARLTTQTFVNRGKDAGVPMTVQFRPSGTHSWPYWQFEMTQSWPQAARALSTEESTSCSTKGEIGRVASGLGFLAGCTTDEYVVDGGVAQDFRGGQVFWSGASGAHPVYGAIGGLYQGLGGPNGSGLGLPISGEAGTPDGRGRYTHFQNGSIYFTPKTGAHSIRGEIREAWKAGGWENGPLGYPTSEEAAIEGTDGIRQDFEHGTMYWSPRTGAHWVTGAIRARYDEIGGPGGAAGFPTSDENGIRGGAYNAFEHGNLYWSGRTGARFVVFGPIFEAWGREGYENGRFGYPTGELADIPGGGNRITFEHGEIRQVNGKIELG